jgi:hypothetical protein
MKKTKLSAIRKLALEARFDKDLVPKLSGYSALYYRNLINSGEGVQWANVHISQFEKVSDDRSEAEKYNDFLVVFSDHNRNKTVIEALEKLFKRFGFKIFDHLWDEGLNTNQIASLWFQCKTPEEFAQRINFK